MQPRANVTAPRTSIIMYYEEPTMLKMTIAGIILGILFLILIATLSACTLTLQVINTDGAASEIGDDTLSTRADLEATVPLVP